MAIKQHKIRSNIIVITAIAVIFSALIFTLLRASIPYLTNYGEDFEKVLSEQLGLPVEIAMVDADISWLVPRLKLLDVSVYDKDHEKHLMHFREISISLNWIDTIRNLSLELGDVFVFGMDIQVERNEQGVFLVQGIKIEKSDSSDSSVDEINSFFSKTSLYIVDSAVRWIDRSSNLQEIVLTNLNLTMINSGSDHEISIDMDLPDSYGRHLKIISEFEGDITRPELWQGELYVSAINLRLNNWLNDYWELVDFPGSGQLSMDAWVDFKDFSVHKATASLKCNDLVLYYLGEDVESWALDHISMKFQWSQAGNDSIISVNDLYVRRNNRGWPQKTAASLKISDGHEIGFKANYVRLDDFIYFKKIIDVLRPNYELDQIALIDMDTVKADLYDVDVELNINEPEDLLVKGYFREFGYQSKSKIPSINGLDGYVRYDQGRMVFDLSSDGVSLDFNGLFRNKLHLDYLSGEVSVGRRDNDWLVTSDKIIAQSEHLGSDVRMKITIPEQGEVFMDIVSSLYNGDARYVNLYLPASIMNKKTVKWLDEAFVRADIPRGGFLYYGRVDHFPFKNGEGVMEILFDVENAKLKYLHGWPEITNLKSSALFYNSSFSIQGATGHVYGSDLTNVNIAIDDFSDAHLSIGGNISSPLSDMLLFVNNSPLKDMLGDFVAGLEGKGQAGLDLNLEIPLVSDAKLKVNGDLLFKNNNINLPDQGYLLENVTGQLAFTESSIRSDQLQATLNKHMIQIDIESRDHGQKPETLISVAGGLPVKSVLSPVPFLTNYFDGVADWLANIRIPMGGGRQQPKVSIDVKSELLGVSSSLPVPFAKKTDKPVSLDLKINVMHDNTVNLTMLYDSSIRYSAKYDNQLWDMGLISPQLRGSIRFSGKSILDHPVSLKINYLDATAYSSLKTGDSKIKISPANLPSLTVTAKEIVWNKMQFRNVRLKTHPDKSGMIIDQLDLDGPDIQLKGKGSWLTTWRYENRTVLDFSLTTGNLGRCLHELNLSKSIKDADGRGDFKLAWNAEPYNVSLDLIEGESNIKLEDGELVDIKPGAGRILGILNFETLLSLDFGNQVSGGFSFDEIKGSLRFENGNVYTDDMIIEGKVAEINMQGRVGLVAKDFDQTITVIPGVGSTLSVLTTLTSGATVGAAVLFFQKIFGLDKIAEYKYTVSGSWDDPKVTLLSAPEKKKSTRSSEEVIDDDF